MKFIVYFNTNEDFFECHEVLEEYWKSLPNSTKNHPLVAYILLSTGLYHFRRGNTVGALRTLRKASTKMTHIVRDFPEFTKGLDISRLCADLEATIDRLQTGQSFESFPLIVSSPGLALRTKKMELSMDLLPFESDAVIHKHMLRDRTDILLARKEKKKGRI
ncbi:DUF309 domain-containing protein [Sporosarcina sp. G11-34]|uniref:DUF309 domain-containing protein n=1 Tax=Sporosarcina sp. G11-34 TaxID=2849605 RepID=UPI0022A911A0|nr:DUF309 domain-containing protein [Sporosarcina sp. G11-34]